MKVRSICLCGLFAALMAICAWISIPILDTAITLQSFAFVLALLLLGGKWASVTIGVYLLLGAIGAPIFSGFQGGLGALFGPTGGYLWGFVAGALLYWAFTCLGGKKWPLAGVILAMLACYSCGVSWYWFAYAQGGIALTVLRSVLPCLVPDALKIWLAYTMAKLLKPHLF